MPVQDPLIVWWPGLSKQIENLMAQRVTCAKDRPTSKEPLIPASFTSRSWLRIAIYLIELNGKDFFIVIDYYSRWFEIKDLRNETSQVVIQTLKELFAIHGIAMGPTTVQIPFASLQSNMAS